MIIEIFIIISLRDTIDHLNMLDENGCKRRARGTFIIIGRKQITRIGKIPPGGKIGAVYYILPEPGTR